MGDWRDNISPELKTRIYALTLEQAIDIIIYFCGYENGENLVKQAMSD